MWRRWLIVLSLGGVGALASNAYYRLEVRSATDKEIVVEIPAGQRFAQIMDTLQRSDVRMDRFHAYVYAGVRGIYPHMQAGTYSISPRETITDVLEKIARGDVIMRRLTIVEGWTLSDTLAAMKRNPHVRMDVEDPAELARRLGVEQLEGWIHPNTYEFHERTSNIEILRLAYGHMRDLLECLWERRAEDLPLETPYQALILASIVEKETSAAHERARIAGVFLTRLKRKMRLQSDPTVIYGLGKRFDGDLRSADLKQDTPYNTYRRHGLPPTPIAMPSEASLRAVMDPELTGDVYFVSKRDGTHYFSGNYEEHRRAVRKYQ